ncbi:MAG TPA: FAD-dependent oxidoreductase, partial [Alphaproteobacteria bacterium]|nr:FAD-dependent oxidoreductase [Alphaproteobacteria bacterium]
MLPSHWLDEHFARKPTTHQPELEGEVRADVAIVGGGFVGLWTALRLKELEPSLDVVLIERAFCGAGASGRNTGLALPYWVKFLSLAKLCGEAEALRLCRASVEAVETIGRFCERHGIDAHYQRDGWLWTATCKAHEQSWRATIDALERHQLAPFRALAPDEVRALSRSPVHLAGVLDPA